MEFSLIFVSCEHVSEHNCSRKLPELRSCINLHFAPQKSQYRNTNCDNGRENACDVSWLACCHTKKVKTGSVKTQITDSKHPCKHCKACVSKALLREAPGTRLWTTICIRACSRRLCRELAPCKRQRRVSQTHSRRKRKPRAAQTHLQASRRLPCSCQLPRATRMRGALASASLPAARPVIRGCRKSPGTLPVPVAGESPSLSCSWAQLRQPVPSISRKTITRGLP